MKSFKTLWLSLLLILTSCSTLQTPLPPSDNEPVTSEVRKIIFAADFDTNGGCEDHKVTNQCDLYTADLNLDDGSVTNVVRVTDTSVSESYPAWNPNGDVAYYSIFKDTRTKDLGLVDLSSSETQVLLSTATWPEVSPDGSTLLYTDTKSELLMEATLSTDGLSIGTGTALTGVKDQEDPQYSGDGRYIVFHEITDKTGAVGQVYDTQTEQIVSWESASGHCAIGLESLITVCDNSKGGGLFEKTFTGSGFNPSSLFLPDPKASELSTYDESFASCQGISFNYPNFCGDDEHLLVSTSCNMNGEVDFSRLFLVDFTTSSPVYRPIGKALKDAYGGTGISSWTVSCLE